MPDSSRRPPAPSLGHAGGVFLGLAFRPWIMLAGIGAADLLVGVPAVAPGAVGEPRPAAAGRARFDPAAALGLRRTVPGRSLAAAIDVMRRAFDPRLPLSVGFISCPAISRRA